MSVRTYSANLLTGWESIFYGFMEDRDGVIDKYNRNVVQSFNNMIRVKSAVFDVDFDDWGITQTKWTKFTGQYCDIPALHAWVKNARNCKTYDSLYQFKSVRAHYEGGKAVHQWGSCLLALSFRRQPKPNLTFYTRAQSIGFSGVADYGLLHFVAKEIAKVLRVPQEKIGATIYCTNFVFKPVEGIQLLARRGKLEEYLQTEGRMVEAIKYYLRYFDSTDGTLAWRAANRFRHKWRQYEAGIRRPLIVDRLTLRGWPTLEQQWIDGHNRRTHRETQQFVLTRQPKGHAG